MTESFREVGLSIEKAGQYYSTLGVLPLTAFTVSRSVRSFIELVIPSVLRWQRGDGEIRPPLRMAK